MPLETVNEDYAKLVAAMYALNAADPELPIAPLSPYRQGGGYIVESDLDNEVYVQPNEDIAVRNMSARRLASLFDVAYSTIPPVIFNHASEQEYPRIVEGFKVVIPKNSIEAGYKKAIATLATAVNETRDPSAKAAKLAMLVKTIGFNLGSVMLAIGRDKAEPVHAPTVEKIIGMPKIGSDGASLAISLDDEKQASILAGILNVFDITEQNNRHYITLPIDEVFENRVNVAAGFLASSMNEDLQSIASRPKTIAKQKRRETRLLPRFLNLFA
jgi:hypothetical protein